MRFEQSCFFLCLINECKENVQTNTICPIEIAIEIEFLLAYGRLVIWIFIYFFEKKKLIEHIL